MTILLTRPRGRLLRACVYQIEILLAKRCNVITKDFKYFVQTMVTHAKIPLNRLSFLFLSFDNFFRLSKILTLIDIRGFSRREHCFLTTL